MIIDKLVRTTHDIEGRYLALLKPTGLNMAMAYVLAYLYQHSPQWCTPTDIASALGRSRSNISVMLSFLINRGDVERDINHSYRITSKGTSVALTVERLTAELDAELRANLFDLFIDVIE